MRKLLFIIALFGLLVSGYLLYTYVAGGPIVCSTNGGCEIVRASQYATILGLPTPAHGVIFYLLLGMGAILWVPEYKVRLRVPLLALTSIGVAVSAWLTYLEAFVVRAWCSWCLVSALLTVLAFLLVLSTIKRNDSYHGN